ncbi:MAG: orotidine-5'-phosphate decarboxylase [bacterium]|nr:orotidine-5'-phosphate decarboxylase [bacterium]
MNPLIVALDTPDEQKVKRLIDQLALYVGAFKIGLELYTALGPTIIRYIQNLGGKVFLDIKFHDIPNTVAGAAAAATRHKVWMFNVHCSGGLAMMHAAVQSAKDTATALNLPMPIILGVTILTSINEMILKQEIRIEKGLTNQVVHFALLAHEAGLNGVVASPREIVPIREKLGKEFIILTPGIRPSWASDAQDQKRIMTPQEAIAAGANYIVVGRPITLAPNPVDAAQRIIEEIS